MATAQNDTLNDENPNSMDRPEGVQQVMSPKAAAGHSAKASSTGPLMNGRQDRPLRGELDMNDELVSGTDRGGVGSAALTGGVTSTAPVTVKASSIPSDHFLATGAAAVHVSQSPELRQQDSAGAAPSGSIALDPGCGAGRGTTSTQGTFLSGVARAVSAFPTAVEGMVTRTQTTASRTSPLGFQEVVDGYVSAQSGSPGDGRNPATFRLK